VLVVVAVRVDAVVGGGGAAAVVVAEVLAPEALDIEGVLVAVGIVDEHEPQLVVLEQPPDVPVVGPPAVDVPVEQAAVDLGADPLASVVGGGVQQRRAGPIGNLVGALGELQGDVLPPLVRPAQDHQLDELRVAAGELVHLVADAPRLVVGPPHREPRRAWTSARWRCVRPCLSR
jgi:hypothetical protein